MAKIKIKEGLDIPMEGQPSGAVQTLPAPKELSLNLSPFDGVKFKLLRKAGDFVKTGEAIAYDKDCPQRMFVSPGCGTIKEVRRGLRRRLLDVVIELQKDEQFEDFGAIDVNSASKEDILEKLLKAGAFARIRMRPFNILAKPEHTPRDIFIKAIQSAPFTPEADLQVEGHEDAFQAGITALSKLTIGNVHLVYREGSTSTAFTGAQNCVQHTAEGPHPAGNSSVHIHHIAPVKGYDDIVWTLTALDVVIIGKILTTGRYHTDRVVSVAGNGIIEAKRGFFKVREGYPVSNLVAERNEKGLQRFISGDPLVGDKVEVDDFLGFYHTAFCAIPENVSREILHFFRPGFGKYSFTKNYVSGHMSKDSGKKWGFTTNNHGEHRAFIDGSIYDKVMPMQIPTMVLLKSIIGEDWDRAEECGLLEIDSEDFALPAFIDPSKTEMVEIVKNALSFYAHEVMH